MQDVDTRGPAPCCPDNRYLDQPYKGIPNHHSTCTLLQQCRRWEVQHYEHKRCLSGTGVHISEKLKEATSEWGIGDEEVVAVFHDNSAIMALAAHLLEG